VVPVLRSLEWVKAILRPPSFPDEERTQQAFLLHVILWTLVMVPLPYVAWALAAAREIGPEHEAKVLLEGAVGEAITIALMIVMRRGWVRAASLLQVCTLWCFFLWTALSASGIRDLSYTLGFAVVITIAGLLLGVRGAVAATCASIAAGAAMLAAESLGWRFGASHPPSLVLAVTFALFPVFAALQYLGNRSLERALRRARQDLAGRLEAEAERERLHSQLAHAQRVESIGRLAGGIAHDFNNLLTGILGNVSFALHDLAPGNPLREPLEDAQRAGHSAAKLTQQLLAFGRKQLVRPRVVDPNRAVAGIEKMLRRLLGEDVVLEVTLRPDAGRVCIDPGQLEQVLVNLAVNARQAMPGGGRLFIETAWRRLDAEGARGEPDLSPGDYVAITVRDTGPGMSPEVLQRLFEPFFTTKEKGTGLGLAMVHGIVKQGGGAISVASGEGKGASFEVLLPRTLAPEESLPTTSGGTPPRGGSESILVVEDDALVRELAVKALRRLGYTVVPCADGEEALVAFAGPAAGVDLVVTDVVMPGIDGWALADRLAAARPGLRILFTSGYAETTVADRGPLRPDVQLIAKPYTPEALAAKVRELLDV
jgi:signal transduction histidine kinase/CheY-like chemotaxis protein